MPSTRRWPRTVFLLVAACRLALFGSTLEAQASDTTLVRRLETTMNGLVEQGEVRGAALVLVRDTGVIYQRGFGSPGEDHRIHVDPEQTVFRAASLSKLFVATAVLQLREQGRVDLAENVDRYLRGMVVTTDHDRPVTLHALLTHTSGIENRMLGALVARPEALISLDSFFRRQPPRQVSPAGAGIQYSNTGMAFAGYLVEQVTGERFDRYAESHIFQPLGMTRSSFVQPIPDSLALALGDPERTARAPLFLPYPAASLVATPADMGRFVCALLNGGVTARGRILQPETSALMQAQHWTSHPEVQGVAYGLFESTAHGERALFHTGDAGDHSLIYLLPARHLGLFVVLRGVGDAGTLPMLERLVAQLHPDATLSDTMVPAPVADAASRAGQFAGLYGANGVNPYTIERAAGLLQQIRIREVAPGQLRAGPSLDFDPLAGTEIAPYRFRLSDGGELTFDQTGTGPRPGATLTGSIWDPSGMHRIAWYRDARLTVMTIFWTLLLAGVRTLMGLGGLIRRMRRQPVVSGTPSTRRAWTLSGLAAGALLLGPLLAIASLPFLRPPITRMPIGGAALLACWLVGVVAGLPLLLLSGPVWREREWSGGRRGLYLLFAVSLPAFGAVLQLWNLLGFHY